VLVLLVRGWMLVSGGFGEEVQKEEAHRGGEASPKRTDRRCTADNKHLNTHPSLRYQDQPA
jgi:hypothetical protein